MSEFPPKAEDNHSNDHNKWGHDEVLEQNTWAKEGLDGTGGSTKSEVDESGRADKGIVGKQGDIVITDDGFRFAIAMARRNGRTGKMEYLISDATTKTEGLSRQRFVTEDEITFTESGDSRVEGPAEQIQEEADMSNEEALQEADTGAENESVIDEESENRLVKLRGSTGKFVYRDWKTSSSGELNDDEKQLAMLIRNTANAGGKEELGKLAEALGLSTSDDSLEWMVYVADQESSELHASDVGAELTDEDEVEVSSDSSEIHDESDVEGSPVFSQEEIDEVLGESVESDESSEAPFSEDEMNELNPEGDEPSDAEQESGEESEKDTYAKFVELLNAEHKDLLDELGPVRNEFLEACAKSQKGHLRRIRPGGRLDNFLNTYLIQFGGAKLAGYLTRPTDAEKQLGDEYTEASSRVYEELKKFLSSEIEAGSLTEEQARAIRARHLTSEHARNAERIAEIQKESSGKPMNKWLRRAGYVAAGVTGGLLSLTALGMTGGLLVAGAGAIALRVKANKQNAKTENKKTEKLFVDEQVSDYKSDFSDKLSGLSQGEDGREGEVSDIVSSHYDEISNEVGKNRNRITVPVAATVGTAVLTRMGIDLFNNLNQPDGTYTPPAETDPGDRTPADPGDVDPGDRTPVTPDDVPKPEVDPEPEILGQNFDVESGHGYTHELQDFAGANGKELTGDQAWQLHNDLIENFGNDYIDINGPGGDIYTQAGDVRLAEPGSATWKDGVAGYIQDWMSARNLW